MIFVIKTCPRPIQTQPSGYSCARAGLIDLFLVPVHLSQSGDLIGVDEFNDTQVVICLLGKTEDVFGGRKAARKAGRLLPDVVEIYFIAHNGSLDFIPYP